MANRIKPLDVDRNPEDLSMGPQRNDRIVRNAQRQLEYENKAREPKRRSILKDPENEKDFNAKAKASESMEGFGGTMRIDAIVVVVFLIELIGCIAAGIAIYVYGLDQDWNGMLTGKQEFYTIPDKNAFKGKSLMLTGHLYLDKTVEYARRDEFQELFFIIYILVFVVVSFVQMLLCYVRAADVEKNAVLLIALYSVGGGFCIYSSTFLVSAAVNIENGYTYAAEMLHNFQHLSSDEPLTSKEQDRCKKEYKNGCDYYEYGKLQARALEQIFRICGSGSRFTRYYKPKDEDSRSVEIEDEVYYRQDLKGLGFCSQDGYKFTAAILAVFMGVLSALVPILFCCQGKSKKPEPYAEPETGRVMRHHRGETPVQEMQQERQESAPVPEQGETIDQSAVLEQFREYVERDSGNSGEEAKERTDISQ